ncbi:MAG: glycosyltransferase [Gemmatimonadota bacterium]
MKVLDLTEFYSPRGGGVRRYLAEKAAWVAGRPDLDHVVVVPGERDAVTLWDRTRVHLVRGPRVPASPGYHFLIAGRRVARIVRWERPDVIEVGSPYLAPWLARRAARGTPARLAAFVHENPRLYVTRLAWPLCTVLDPLLSRYLETAYRRFDLIVAASADNLPQAGGAPTAVAPLGVDAQLFHPMRHDPTWRSEVGASPGERVALYVGRLSAEKGLETVLEAWPEIRRSSGARLVLIGEGHLRSRLERLARERPQTITVLPYEADPVRLARAYASADLFLAPCPYETFGLAALEAMASGLPVAGVRAAGIGRLLADGEGWARTYTTGDPRDCARAVAGLAMADLAEAGRLARDAAVRRYTWDRTFTELFTLYRRLADQAASQARPSSIAPSAALNRSV